MSLFFVHHGNIKGKRLTIIEDQWLCAVKPEGAVKKSPQDKAIASSVIYHKRQRPKKIILACMFLRNYKFRLLMV